MKTMSDKSTPGVKKRGLGKGLDVLIPESASDTRYNKKQDMMEIFHLDPSDLKPNPYQPRRRMDSEGLEELALSIKEKGILQPVLVRKHNNGYEVIAGERRVKASILAGLVTIPVIIRELNDEAMLEAALIENLQREDLNPLEEAHAYDRLVKMYSLTQEDIAKRVGKNRVTVTNAIRLLKLPLDIQQHVEEGSLTAGHARAILACGNETQMKQLAELIINKGLSVRESEEWVHKQARSKGTKPGLPVDKAKSTYTTDLEERIMREIGLRVSVRESSKNKGRIEVYFTNDEELKRFLDILGIELE